MQRKGEERNIYMHEQNMGIHTEHDAKTKRVNCMTVKHALHITYRQLASINKVRKQYKQ